METSTHTHTYTHTHTHAFYYTGTTSSTTTTLQRQLITNKPIVSVSPLEKYALVDDVRRHSEYTPALAPVSTTLRLIPVDDENTDATLVTPLVGLVHTVDDTTNAVASPLTFTRPAPTNATLCPVPLNTGSTLGVTDVTDTIENAPTKKYGDPLVHRPHN